MAASWRAVLLSCTIGTVGSPAAHALQSDDPRAAERVELQRQLDQCMAARRQGNGVAALKECSPALDASQRLGDEGSEALSLNHVGWALWTAGRYDESLASRHRALAIYRRRGEADGEATAHRGIGETFLSLGRYDEALEQFRLALDALGSVPVEKMSVYSKWGVNPRAQEALILSTMGSTYRMQGRYADAMRVLRQSLAIFRTIDDPTVAQTLTFLGMVSRARGEYDEALKYYAEALDSDRAAGDRRGEAQVLGNMGNVYLDLGEFERTIEMNVQSRAIAEEVGYAAQVGFAEQNTGIALANLSRPQEALRHYEAALATWRAIGRTSQIGWTVYHTGVVRLHQLNDPARARASFEEALQVGRAVQEPDLEVSALLDLGNVELRLGHALAAIARYDQALEIARTSAGPDLEYRLRADRGRALQALGRTAEAVQDLRASARIVNDLRANVRSDQSKIGYMDTRQQVFHDLATVLASAGRAEEALEAAEAGRARAFADLLMVRRVRGKPAEADALAQFRSAMTDAASFSRAAGAAPDGPSRRGDPLNEARARIEGQNPELASLVTVDSPTTGEIRATAARLGATLVEFLVTEERLLAWVIQPKGAVHSVQMPRSRAGLADSVKDVRRQIDEVDLSGLRQPERLNAAFRELDRQLIAPLARWLPSSPDDLVIIVPHGPLLLLPFAALLDDSGRPLAARHTLSFAPAVSVFRYTGEKQRRSRGTSAGALVVADPLPPAGSGLRRLPGSRDEGRRVAARLRTAKGRLLIGAAASEAAVKRTSGGTRTLHFATHGLVSEIRPDASSLLLSEGDGEDGYLRVDEIIGLDLTADLVVLSGCSTGMGRLSGDGILGLTRAFIYAGTPSVVVSQWDVSDLATTYFMDRFYGEMQAGRTKAQALRAAQLASRARFGHPALWAAFSLVGEP